MSGEAGRGFEQGLWAADRVDPEGRYVVSLPARWWFVPGLIVTLLPAFFFAIEHLSPMELDTWKRDFAILVAVLSALALLAIGGMPRYRLRIDPARGRLDWAMTVFGRAWRSRSWPREQVESLHLRDSPGTGRSAGWPVIGGVRMELAGGGSVLELGSAPRAVAFDVSGRLARKLELVVEDHSAPAANREAAGALATSEGLPAPPSSGLATVVRREGTSLWLDIPVDPSWWTIASWTVGFMFILAASSPLVLPAALPSGVGFVFVMVPFIARSTGLLAWRRRLTLHTSGLEFGSRRLAGPVRVRTDRLHEGPGGRLILVGQRGGDLVLRVRVAESEGRWLAAVIEEATAASASPAP